MQNLVLIGKILDICASIATVIMAVTAIWGIKTWRREAKFKIRLELAQKVSPLLQELKDELAQLSKLPKAMGWYLEIINKFQPSVEKELQIAKRLINSIKLLKDKNIIARLAAIRYETQLVSDKVSHLLDDLEGKLVLFIHKAEGLEKILQNPKTAEGDELFDETIKYLIDFISVSPLLDSISEIENICQKSIYPRL